MGKEHNSLLVVICVVICWQSLKIYKKLVNILQRKLTLTWDINRGIWFLFYYYFQDTLVIHTSSFKGIFFLYSCLFIFLLQIFVKQSINILDAIIEIFKLVETSCILYFGVDPRSLKQFSVKTMKTHAQSPNKQQKRLTFSRFHKSHTPIFHISTILIFWSLLNSLI